MIRALPLRTMYRYLAYGEWRELRDPHGPPSPRQLLRLNHEGMLAVIEPGQLEPVTKGEAAYALDYLTRREAS